MNGTITPGLEAVILKALDKDPGLRYQTAKDLLVDLERLRGAQTPGAASPPDTLVSPRGRRWLALASVTAIALAACAWFLRPPQVPRVTAVRPLTGDVTLGTGSTPLLGGAATDGSRVYYLARDAGRTDLLQVPVTGGDAVEVPLPFGFNYRCLLGYAPAESALLMLGTTETANDDAPDFGVPLWRVPVPTGTTRRIPNLRARWSDLSRDGRTLVLVHLDTDRPGAIGLFRHDTGAGRTARLVGAEDLRYPRCSVQGHLLAAGRSETRGFHYWMRRAGSTTWTEVGAFPLSHPSWRRDGRSFCGLNWLDRSSYSVDCVSVDSGRVDEVFALGTIVPMVLQAARWTGLDDDRPLVVADRNTTALYALDWEAP